MNRKGFTLIELLIVVVIIGILAAIAIPKFSSTKEKAYVASMKSDLRNLATAQEGYFSDNTQYFAGPAGNVGGTTTPAQGWVPSSGVTVAITPTTGGWAASATHAQTSKSCGIFYGTGASPNAAVTVEGEPACW